MSYDYNTFAATIANLAVYNGTEPEFLQILPQAINAAELRCYRDLDLLSTRTTNSYYLGVGVISLAAPSSLVVPLNVFISSPTRINLLPASESYLNDYWPDRGITGVPKYWYMETDQSIVILPPPTSSYTVSIYGTYRPTPLSSGNPTTWLTTWEPDLFLYAAMVFVTGYQKNFGAQSSNPAQGVSWEQQYKDRLANALVEEAKRQSKVAP